VKTNPRDLVENEEGLVYILDKKGRFIFASSALETLLHYEHEELLGRDLMDLVSPEWQERTQSDLCALLQNGELKGETILVDKRGSRHFLEYGSLLLKEDDRVIGAVAMARDIAEINLIQRTLTDQKARLRILLKDDTTTAQAFQQYLEEQQAADLVLEFKRKMSERKTIQRLYARFR
jgi:PAS domain S-box-containing protein